MVGSKSINMVKPFQKIYVQQDNHFSEANTLYSYTGAIFSIPVLSFSHCTVNIIFGLQQEGKFESLPIQFIEMFIL